MFISNIGQYHMMYLPPQCLRKVEKAPMLQSLWKWCAECIDCRFFKISYDCRSLGNRAWGRDWAEQQTRCAVQRREEQSREKKSSAETRRAEQTGDRTQAEQREEQRRKGAADETQRRSSRDAKAWKPKLAESSAISENEKETETRWEARCYIESAQRRVRVVANATRTQPKRGAHLAPLTSLTGAAHARGCIRRAREQHRSRGASKCAAQYRVRHVT